MNAECRKLITELLTLHESIKTDMVLHVVKSLVCLPSIHTLSFVGVVVDGPGSGVRPVHRVLGGSFVGHPIIPEG